MDKSLAESILSVCKILNKYSVQYLISGGTAVALHGYLRIRISRQDFLLINMILIFGIILFTITILDF